MGKQRARSYVRVAVVVLILFLALAVTRPSVRQAIRLATTHQPERFSELYFANYAELPKTLTVDRPYYANFVITNHEARRQTYTYQVRVTENGKPTHLSRSTILLADGRGQVVSFSYSPTTAGSKIEVTITLDGKPQTIRYRAVTAGATS